MDDHDPSLVLKTAALARLEITAEEARVLAPQFAAILAQFQVLAELDVEGVEPTTGAPGQADVTRGDEPRPSWPREALLLGAPDPREGFYAVPKTIGGPERPGEPGAGGKAE